MKEAPLFAFAQRLNMMKKGNEKEGAHHADKQKDERFSLGA